MASRCARSRSDSLYTPGGRDEPASTSSRDNSVTYPRRQSDANSPIDLWVELDRLGRDDRAMLAARWDAVRRSRVARRAITKLAAVTPLN